MKELNRCPYCNDFLDYDARFCNNCGEYLSGFSEKRARDHPNFFKGLTNIPKLGIIGAACIALLLAVVLIVGFVTNWFGTTGPAVQIASAVKDTLASKNFSVDFVYTLDAYREYTTEIQGTAHVSFNIEEQELILYADIIADEVFGSVAIYDGYYIVSIDRSYYGYDISNQLNAFFDAYKEYTEDDWAWEDLFNAQFPNAPQDIIDFDILNDCAAEYVKNLNSKKWLEENAEYSVDKEDGITRHLFTPDIYSFLRASLVQFEDIFRKSSDYDDVYGELRDLKPGAKCTNTEIVVGIRSGKLSEFCFDISGPYEGLTYGNTLHVEADFYDICKTEFDYNELEDMLAEAIENS